MHSLGMNRAWHILGSGQTQIQLSKVSSNYLVHKRQHNQKGQCRQPKSVPPYRTTRSKCATAASIWQKLQGTSHVTTHDPKTPQWNSPHHDCCFSICTVLTTALLTGAIQSQLYVLEDRSHVHLSTCLHHWVKSQKGLKEDQQRAWQLDGQGLQPKLLKSQLDLSSPHLQPEPFSWHLNEAVLSLDRQ